jgi:spermidine dehydrogenase
MGGGYDQIPSQVTDSGEIYDCTVLRGGFSGLSAALFFLQRTGATRNCIVLGNAAIFEGVAKRNAFTESNRAVNQLLDRVLV